MSLPGAPGAVPPLAGAAVAIAIPLLFLYLVRRLDLYGSSDRGAVALCIAWGAAAFGAAYVLNTSALEYLGMPRPLVLVGVVPVVEELAKSGVLIDRVRRPSFTYFVDGAILGFATGTGFAVVENVFYLGGAAPGDGLGLSMNRAFSSSLMHGTACAIVGVALGRWRFGRGARPAIALGLGLGLAMALHAAFNAFTDPARGVAPAVRVYGAIAVGLLGVVGVALLILQGLRDERAWLREALAPSAGVTAAEADAVQQLRQVRALLAPVEAHFGAARADEVAELLRLQARFGLKRQAAALAPDGPLKRALAAEADALRGAMAGRQRAIGLYVMSYVRAVWPAADDTLWARLDQAVAAAPAGGDNLWATIGARADERKGGVMGRTISIHSYRGGTGKTNLSANLAALLVRAGRRVAVVDTDIQSPGLHVPFGWSATPTGPTLNEYLWGACAIEAAAYPVAEADIGPGLFLVPGSLSTAAITKVLREGFDVGRLNEGFRRLKRELALDALIIDTHPGLNPETLLSLAVSDCVVVVLRPDQQDYQGTSVTVDVARRLEVPELAVLLNKVPDGTDRAALGRDVEAAYGCPVLAVLPHSDALMRLSSAGLFAVRHPEDPLTNALRAVAERLVPAAATSPAAPVGSAAP